MASPDSDSQGPIFWERLRNLFTPDRDDRAAASDQPRHRGVVITACVLISFFLWLTFTLQEQKIVTLPMPTQVVNLPPDQALEELPPSTVNVQVEGEGLQLLWLYYNPPTIPLDANDGQINLSEAIDLPGDVRLESVSPRQITLQKGERVTRRIPVWPRVSVKMPPAHELIGTPQIRPDSIDVAGARSVVASIGFWPTDSLTIEGLTDSIATRVPLADTLRQLVSRNRDYVTFIAKAGKFAEAAREIDVEVTGVPSDQDVVALEPSAIRVQYRVLFDQLFESQRAPDFFATVSYNQIRTDTTGYVRPQLHLPADLIIRDPESIPSRLRYYTYVGGD